MLDTIYDMRLEIKLSVIIYIVSGACTPITPLGPDGPNVLVVASTLLSRHR